MVFGLRNFLLGAFLLGFIVVFSSFASAYYCWDYDSDAVTCNSKPDCIYHTESWGGWCEELNCWSLSQTECSNTTLTSAIDKNCRWKSSSDWGWCSQTSCWSFQGTNQTYCEDSTAHGLNCEWHSNCNGWNPDTNCWDLTTEIECGNVSGCSWGECMDEGCWNYNESTCASNTGSRGQTCQWNSASSYCYEPSCWDYGGSSSNESWCEDFSITGLNCTWIDNYYVHESCEELSCWHYDYTNESQCENTTLNGGINCTWDGQYCMMDGCWNYNTQEACVGANGCSWETSTGSGWCEELMCWSFDTWSGGNEVFCENATTDYNLTCTWTNDTYSATAGDGWCNPSMSESCANFTSERDCMDTYYCWWEYVDWADTSTGGTCKDPDWSGEGLTSDDNVFSEWNPGCYIFDMNSTDCNRVVGCNYSNNMCNTTGNEDNAVLNVTQQYIQDNGLNCSMINDSALCNNLPVLSTCCEWSGGSCITKLDKSCWENADREQQGLGIVACEDVGMQTSTTSEGETLCQQIAAYPLYMPCEWSNVTKKCSFKSGDVFGNKTQSFALIENKKNCEASGGKWIQEFYCEGNRSIPAGRCEQKGSDEKNCNKACFACEYKFTGAAHNSSSAASEYCYDSNLGYCEFVTDSSAPNGYGYCRAKDEFIKGIATDCKNDCGSCTYMGNPNAATYSDARPDLTPPLLTSYNICNTPKCYCEYAKGFNNVSCKWVVDASSTTIGGYCVSSSEKICEDSCDRCYTQDDCSDKGRKAFNATGSCEWTESNGQYVCTKRTGGDGVAEICWDGIDNDADNLIDCVDSECYADSFCGFVDGDCFGWSTQATCEIAQLGSGLNCTWVTDPWGSWCDFPGASCWKYDGNQSSCILNNATCEWTEGQGNSWCEQDWSLGQDCYNIWDESTCAASASNCTWTNDTWCGGEGSDNDWCTTQGGWCDPASFAPKNCWNYDGNEAGCGNVTGCYYEGSFCYEQGCWNYDGNQSACDAASGCNWEYNDWGAMCEIDWGGNCWQFNESTCAVNNCSWRTDTWGGWCDNKFSGCWDLGETACGLNSNCFWNDFMWNWNTQTQGMCDATCFNPDLTQSTCGEISGCRWSDGWCMSNATSGTGGIDCWSFDDNETGCGNTTGCKWRIDGWCNPKGFSGGDAAGGTGMGAQTGIDCWKYDGNQSLCTNSSLINISCMWMPEFRPFCEPNWAADCWKFHNESHIVEGYNCTNATGCYWDGNGDFCANAFDQCWSNSTLNSNETQCNDNANCNWTTGWGDYNGAGWCEPSCFQSTTQETCTGNCNWMSGWCNSPGMNNMFGGMEMGIPAMIAMDNCMGELPSTPYLDICGAGMRDMDKSFGFASGTSNFADAGICNNEKIGFGFEGGGNNFGNGNATVRYYVYLDSDGSTTGGCALSHNSSAVGYEFFFSYKSSYNATKGKATETFNAQKCGSGGWVTADISLSSYKQKMCGEIQGPMIAVEKAALEKFPVLYNSGADMRVFVATAGASNNASSPTDTAGPGWITPGAIDFPIAGFFELGANVAIFEKILMDGGFVKGEDCYNGVDDGDADSLADCDDWDCEFSPHCEGVGVNAVGYVDSSMPIITGVKVEEYPDAALVMYDTNKPTNGTLIFYHNDSTCSATTFNRTIYDSTTLTSVRNFTMWHYAHVYNFTGSLVDYALENGTKYYYRLQVCDSGNKCSTSACTSFRTAESASRCGYCNFVTIISPPSGWSVNYDLDRDNNYEHLQGLMCGPSAGMKTNYTLGRKANVKLNNTDGAEMIFMNVTLTKTGLTGNTRTISTAGDLIFNDSLADSSGNTVELVGMISDTRDKIINNLHPEVCQIKIPNDDCSQLWHCDDNGANCVRRDNATTDAPTGTADGTSCLWNIPYCEFSTWASGEPYTPSGSSSSSSSSGGGSSGGGGGGSTTYTVSEVDFSAGYTKTLKVSDRFKFMLGNDSHYTKLVGLTTTSATVEVTSDPQTAVLSVGGVKKFELTDDNYYDLSVTLNNIVVVNGSATNAEITIQANSDKVVVEGKDDSSEGGGVSPLTGGAVTDEGQIIEGGKGNTWLFLIIGVVIVIAVVVFILYRKRN